MQKKLTSSLLGIGFLVLVASIAFQGFEQNAFADVMMSNVTVSCGLHCVMKPVVQPVGKIGNLPSPTLQIAPGVHPVGKTGPSNGKIAVDCPKVPGFHLVKSVDAGGGETYCYYLPN